MKKLFLGLLMLLPFSARAADTTLAVTAGSGTTIVVTPSGSDIVPHSIPCDHTTPSQCAAFDSTGHLAVLAPPNATALAASNASAPLAAGLMVSDSSLMQRVFAPVIIGDAVNGNNMLATGVWGFNGTTWDRVQVDASKNLKVAPTTGLAQASTTSGQIGPLVQCAVTTGAPSYTNAQTDPLSCNTDGGLRVALTNGAVASGAIASGAVASGALATGAGSDGWDITQGAKGDSACGTATGTCSLVALLKFLNSTAAAAIPAGSAIIGKVGIDQTTFGTTNGVANAANAYETVAASQTAQALGATGATGDYLSHCTALPTSTSPGVVTILDNSTAIYSFPGGASSLSNLVPWTIPVGAVSVSGAWKITTGSAITVTCVGHFT